jgi:hypothetical protein
MQNGPGTRRYAPISVPLALATAVFLGLWMMSLVAGQLWMMQPPLRMTSWVPEQHWQWLRRMLSRMLLFGDEAVDCVGIHIYYQAYNSHFASACTFYYPILCSCCPGSCALEPGKAFEHAMGPPNAQMHNRQANMRNTCQEQMTP